MELAQDQTIQVIRLDLDDVAASQQLSQRRNIHEYDPSSINDHHFLLPINVDRFLLSREAIAELQKAVQTYQIEDAHIRIIKQCLLCPTSQGVKLCFVPLHITTSFRYQGLRICGSYFVSLLHTVAAVLPESLWNAPWATNLREGRQPLSPQQRQELLEYYMRSYLAGSASCTDLTAIAIPGKPAASRGESPTHLAFSNLAIPCSNSNECVISTNGSDMYLFSHRKEGNEVEKVRKLLTEQKFLDGLSSFTWSSRIIQKQKAIAQAEWQQSAFILLYQQQFYPILEWLRVTWKRHMRR